MEQTESQSVIHRSSELIGITSYVAFIAFSGCVVFSAFGRSLIESEVYITLAIAIAIYVLSLKLSSLGLASLAWLILGILCVTSFFLYSVHGTSYFTLTLLVLLLIVFFEETRFSFVIQPVVRKAADLNEESLDRLQTLIRNHSLTLLQVSLISLLSSLAVEYLFIGTIAINPAATGVIILASLSVVLVALLVFAGRTKP